MAIGRPIEQTPNIADKVVTATATAGQTEFTVTGGYRVNHLAVFRNGVRLVNGNDFTALDGVTVTLMEDASNLDVLEFQVFDSFSVSDALLTNAASQTVNGDVTVNGTFTVGSGGIGTFTAAEVVVGIVSSTTGITTVKSVQAASSTTTGALQVKGGVGIGKSLYVGGNVSVGGTLTYEDVTNVDSVGLVTAGLGLRATAGGVVVTAGVSTFPVVAVSAGTTTKDLLVTGVTTATGNVLIGGPSHTSRPLAVHATTNSVVLIEGASNGTSSLMLGDENDEDVGMIQYNHVDNDLAFTVNTGEALAIKSDGQLVSSGTGAELNLTNTGSTATEQTAILYTSGSGIHNQVHIKTSTNNGGDPYIKFDAGGQDMIVGERYAGTTNNLLVLGPGNDPDTTSGIFVKGTGDVGIGTDNPGGDLHIVDDDSSARIYLTSGNSDDSTLYFGRVNDTATGAIRYDHSDDSLRLYGYNNSERLRITSAGKVGINEDVPQSTLHVASTSNYVDIGLSNSTSGHTGSDGANIFLNNSLELGLWNRESTGIIRFATAGTERMRITSDAIVDITGKLRIDISTTGTAGSGNAEGIFLRNTNQTDGNCVSIFGGADDYAAAASAINFVNVDHSANAGDITFDTRNGSNSYATRFKITSDGNIDIPVDSAKLRIGAGQDFYFMHNGTSNYVVSDNGVIHLRTNYGLHFDTAGSANTWMKCLTSDNQSTTAATAVELYYANVKEFETIQYGARAGQQLDLYHQSSNSYIKNNTGNLHIGTDGGTYIYGGKDFGEYCATFLNDGAVTLYNDHTARFATNGNGAQVYGNTGTIFQATCATNSTATVVFQNNEANSSGDMRLDIKTAANQGSDPYIFFDSGGSNMIVGQHWLGTTNNELRLGTGNAVHTVSGIAINGNGQVYMNALNSGSGASDVRYSTSSKEIFYDSSSRLVKTDIEDLSYGLDAINQLRPRIYKRTDCDGDVEVGFIADEVVNIIPEIVPTAEKSLFTKNEEDTEIVPSYVEYKRLTAVLTKAVQELSSKNEALEARIAALESS